MIKKNYFLALMCVALATQAYAMNKATQSSQGSGNANIVKSMRTNADNGAMEIDAKQSAAQQSAAWQEDPKHQAQNNMAQEIARSLDGDLKKIGDLEHQILELRQSKLLIENQLPNQACNAAWQMYHTKALQELAQEYRLKTTCDELKQIIMLAMVFACSDTQIRQSTTAFFHNKANLKESPCSKLYDPSPITPYNAVIANAINGSIKCANFAEVLKSNPEYLMKVTFGQLLIASLLKKDANAWHFREKNLDDILWQAFLKKHPAQK